MPTKSPYIDGLFDPDKQHPFLRGLQGPTDIERLLKPDKFGLGPNASKSFLSRFQLQVNATKPEDDLLLYAAPYFRGGGAAAGVVSGIKGIQGGIDALAGTFGAISRFNGYIKNASTTRQINDIGKTVGFGGYREATFANVVGNAVSLSNLTGGAGLTAAQVTGMAVALSALSDVGATFASQNYGPVALSNLTDTAATSANQTYGSVRLSNLTDLAATFAQKIYGSVSLSNLSDIPATFATQTYNSLTLSNLTDTPATSAYWYFNDVAMSNLVDTGTYATRMYNDVTLSNLTDVTAAAATKLFNLVTLSNQVDSPATFATQTYNSVSLSNLSGGTKAYYEGQSVKLSNLVDKGPTAATMTFNDVMPSPIDPSAAKYFAGGDVTLSNQTDTKASRNFSGMSSGGSVANKDFGQMTINGYTVIFGKYTQSDTQKSAVIDWMADAINDTLGLNDQVYAYRSGGGGGAKLVIEAINPGSDTTINISAVSADSDGNGSNNVANGITIGSSTGTDAYTDFGNVTINGVTTNIGQIRNRDYTSQTAAQYIADKINATSMNEVIASVDSFTGRLVLTQKIAGTMDTIVINNAGGGVNGSSTGLASGNLVAGSDGGYSSTDFGTVRINGVDTVLGTYNDWNYTQLGAAQFIVDKINANTANQVIASLDGTKIKLTQKSVGAAYTIQVENIGNTGTMSTGLVAGTYATGTDAFTATTDFGQIRINGVTTTIGIITNNQHTTASAAQFIADKINANSSNSVVASVFDGDRIKLTQKTAGSAYTISITRNGNTSQGQWTGLAKVRIDNGTDSPITDFGTVRINGVDTYIGEIINSSYTTTTAAQYIAQLINNNSYNTVTATTNGDKLVLTQKFAGSNHVINVENIGKTANNTNTGLTLGTVANGSDAGRAVTDFGTVRINGVDTVIGQVYNSDLGYSNTTAAQYIANKINQNALNSVTATVESGKLRLTHKTTGSAYSVNVENIGGTANNTTTGLVLGNTANGVDGSTATTDFGTIRINGVDTYIGSINNNQFTAASAAQYIMDKINQNSANSVIATRSGSKLILTQKTMGSAYTINVQNIGNTANGTSTGLILGNTANGEDGFVATTDFGTIRINGVDTNLGTIINHNYTLTQAVDYLVNTINANTANTVTASRSGNRLVLTQKTAGSANTINVEQVGNTANGTTTGLILGNYANGTDGTTAQTDFGSITINGVTTNIGSIQNSLYTAATAAQYVADQINANTLNSVVASTNGDRLVLTQKTAGAAYTINVTNKGNTLNGTDTGLVLGNTANGTDGVYGNTDFGSVTINGVTTNIGSIYNGSYTAATAAQYIADQINANVLNTVAASVSGDQLVLTQKTAGAAYTIDITNKGNTADGQDTGLVVGNTANGTDTIYATTDFGSVTINGETVNLGTIQNNLYTSTTAAEYIRDLLNANLTTVTASTSGDQLILTQNTAGSAYTIDVTNKGNTADGQDTGLVVGNTANGTDTIYATTDFGSVTINGETVNLGTIQNNLYTSTTAAEYIRDLLNANLTTVTASTNGDQLILTQNTAGSAYTIDVTNKGNTADGQDTGLVVGNTANGTDAVIATTDFGSVTINGETVNLGTIQNNLYTTTTAADYIRDLLNANLTTVTASTNGDQITLTQNTPGSAYTINITAAGNTSDGQTTGFSVGTTANGTDSPATTDFGSITINGITTNLGTLQNNLYTNQTAAQYIASQINANSSNTVTASVQGDQLVLTSKIEGSSGVINISQIGNTNDATSTGLAIGITANGEDGSEFAPTGGAGSTPVTVIRGGGAEVVDERVYARLGDILAGINSALDRIQAEKGITGVSRIASDVADQLKEITHSPGLASIGIQFEVGDKGVILKVDENQLLAAAKNDPDHVSKIFEAESERLGALAASVGYEAHKVAFLGDAVPEVASFTAQLKLAQFQQNLYKQALAVTDKLARPEDKDEQKDPAQKQVAALEKQDLRNQPAVTVDYRIRQIQQTAQQVQPAQGVSGL